MKKTTKNHEATLPRPGLASSAEEQRERLAFRAAELHLGHGLAQIEVSRELAVSPATVSRLLAYARERGFVQISLVPPREDLLSRQLEEELRPFGIRTVLVAGGEGRGLVGYTAARYFERHAPAKATVVLDGGWTVRDFVSALTTQTGRDLTLVPICADPPSYVISAYELMTLMAMKCVQAHCQKLPHLTRLTKSKVLQQIHEQVVEAALAAEFVFLGLGPWRKNFTGLEFVKYLGLDPDRLQDDHPDVAAVCGYFALGADGAPVRLEEIEMRMPHALTPQDLRRMAQAPDRHVVLMAASEAKCEPLAAVLRARLGNTLILDEPLARRLAERASELLAPDR